MINNRSLIVTSKTIRHIFFFRLARWQMQIIIRLNFKTFQLLDCLILMFLPFIKAYINWSIWIVLNFALPTLLSLILNYASFKHYLLHIWLKYLKYKPFFLNLAYFYKTLLHSENNSEFIGNRYLNAKRVWLLQADFTLDWIKQFDCL